MSVTIDHASLLADVAGDTTLAAVERALASHDLTLDVDGAEGSSETIAGWLARGAQGARDAWRDPADHLVAGLEARLADGRELRVRPAPRRAVGPDLVTLFVGANERFGVILRAWIRVHPRGVPRADLGALRIDHDPPLSPEEARLLEAIAGELAVKSTP